MIRRPPSPLQDNFLRVNLTVPGTLTLTNGNKLIVRDTPDGAQVA